jgi:hypothetical protein
VGWRSRRWGRVRPLRPLTNTNHASPPSQPTFAPAELTTTPPTPAHPRQHAEPATTHASPPNSPPTSASPPTPVRRAHHHPREPPEPTAHLREPTESITHAHLRPPTRARRAPRARRPPTRVRRARHPPTPVRRARRPTYASPPSPPPRQSAELAAQLRDFTSHLRDQVRPPPCTTLITERIRPRAKFHKPRVDPCERAVRTDSPAPSPPTSPSRARRLRARPPRAAPHTGPGDHHDRQLPRWGAGMLLVGNIS